MGTNLVCYKRLWIRGDVDSTAGNSGRQVGVYSGAVIDWTWAVMDGEMWVKWRIVGAYGQVTLSGPKG